jgi:hypothetical protein
MAKKTKTPTAPKGKRSTRPPKPASAKAAPPVTRPAAAAPATSHRVTARHHRRLLSPAAQRGLDAVKFIRIHQRRPFGKRGEQGIVDIVRQAAHLAAQELEAAQPPQTGPDAC